MSEITNHLEEVALESKEPWDIGNRIRSPHTEDPQLPEGVGWPFDYEPTVLGDERLNEGGQQYGPLFGRDGQVYPPPLEKVPDEVLAMWATTLDEVTHPYLTSRLADLLWLSRYGESPHKYAERAVYSLVETADLLATKTKEGLGNESTLNVTRMVTLQRAASITREINSESLQEFVADATLTHLGSIIQEEQPAPGLVFGLIDAFEVLKMSDRPEGITDAVEQITSTTNDPWIFESGLERLASYEADPELRAQNQERIVRKWLAIADAATDLTRVVYYEKAYEVAERFGFTELRDTALASLQARPAERDEFTSLSTDITISRKEIDDRLSRITDGSSWAKSLASIVRTGPLSGDEQKTIHEVETDRLGLQGIFPTAVFSDEGVVVKHIPGGPAGNPDVVIQRHALTISLAAGFVAEALRLIKERHGSPTPGEIEQFFGDGATREVAEVMARGLEHHLDGRFDEAVHVVFPRLEQSIRKLARDLGLRSVNLPQGEKPGRVRSLGPVIQDLCAISDNDPDLGPWFRYVRVALTDPLGLNLRNKYAHGLAGLGNEIDSAILIHVAVFLCMLRPPVATAGTPEVGEPE